MNRPIALRKPGGPTGEARCRVRFLGFELLTGVSLQAGAYLKEGVDVYEYFKSNG